MNNKCERRMLEVRASDGDNDEMIIEGYAVVYEQAATHGDFTEIIHCGALDGADISDVPLRYNHNDAWLVAASTRNNSLSLIPDAHGLLIRATMLDTQSNRDIYKCIRAGLIDKMSFAFTVAPNGDEWSFEKNHAYREIRQIEKIYDVSIVDSPFYDGTSIYARRREIINNERRKIDRRRECEILKQKILLKGKVQHGKTDKGDN